LQVGHDGRSAMEMVITQHPEPTIDLTVSCGLFACGLWDKILAKS
jgi:hypothetical protein